jgi:hypothetical protein
MSPVAFEDFVEIHGLLARYGHVIDEAVTTGRWDALDEIFTSDIIFDARPAGYDVMSGIETVREVWSTGKVKHPRGHHATNVIITGIDGDLVSVASKGISVFVGDSGTGEVSSVIYRDELRRQANGWRIARRESIRLFPA